MTRALFLDRDGTIIEDTGYVRRVEDVRLIDGVREALLELRSFYRLVLVSNQSGIGRGIFTQSALDAVHGRMSELLSPVVLDGVYYCVHGPDDGCSCRKPRPGMIQRAARELGVELAGSVMVGDKPSDIAAGAAAGCLTALLGFPVEPHTLVVDPEPQPRYVGPTWAALAAALPR